MLAGDALPNPRSSAAPPTPVSLLKTTKPGALQMLDEALGDDLGYDFVGVVARACGLKAQREGERSAISHCAELP